MALENSETTFGPLTRDSNMERVPQSSPLRVSLNTQFESGIPPARVRDELSLEGGVERLEHALANVTRTEANLGLLLRGLKHLAAGATAAREANAELTLELDELRTHLTRDHEEEHALRYRMGQLEQLLDVIRHESANERAFLVEQQDLFLAEILSDHERQVADLRRMLKETLARGSDTHQLEIEELTVQRDQAREYATRCERERDAAWRAVASPSTAIGSISLRAVSVPASSVSAAKQPAAEVEDGARSPSSYSLSAKEIAD
ncbi:MAG: hypothetical protein ABI488_11700 [Polyangiaceae bacterium]